MEKDWVNVYEEMLETWLPRKFVERMRRLDAQEEARSPERLQRYHFRVFKATKRIPIRPLLRSRRNFADLSNEVFDQVDPQALTNGLVDSSFVNRDFQAYDCSDPRGLKAVQLTDNIECKVTDTPVQKTPAKYLLVQKVDFRPFKGFRCKVWETKVMFYCGNYDHQTYIHESYYLKPKIITSEECWEFVKEKKFKGRDIGFGLNILRWEDTGSTYFHTWDVQCEGGTITSESGHRRQGVNVHMQWHFWLLEEELTVTPDGNVYLPSEDIKTTCPYRYGVSCVTSQGRLIWSPPNWKEACPYFHLRTVQGFDVQKDNLTMFVSSDESMVHVQRGTAQHSHFCKAKIIPTNYPQLFLTPNIDNQALNRELPRGALAVMDFTSQQDGYLLGAMRDKLDDTFNQFAKKICQQTAQNIKQHIQSKMMQAQTAMTPITVSLGNGEFATSAAEIWYHYTCTPIIVTARNARKCYSALPVSLDPYDQQRRNANLALPDRNRTYFLEPYSHKITTHAIEQPCVPELSPVYQNAEGRYLAVTPELKLIAPTNFYINTTNIMPAFNLTVEDLIYQLPEGGIYRKETRLAFDHFLQAPIRTKEYETVFFQQFPSQIPAHGIIRLSDAFPYDKVLSFSPFTWIGKVYDFFLGLGEIFTFFLGLYVSWKLLCFFFGIAARMCAMRRAGEHSQTAPGFLRYLGVMLLPSLQQLLIPPTAPSKQQNNQVSRSVQFQQQPGHEPEIIPNRFYDTLLTRLAELETRFENSPRKYD